MVETDPVPTPGNVLAAGPDAKRHRFAVVETQLRSMATETPPIVRCQIKSNKLNLKIKNTFCFSSIFCSKGYMVFYL